MFDLAAIVLAPAAIAASTPLLRQLNTKNRCGWLVAALVSLLFVWLLTYLPVVTEQGFIEFSIAWVPSLGLNLSIYLDGLALVFGLIILGIGAVIVLYTAYYFDELRELIRFYALLLAFMSAMLAVVLAGNVLTLFIAWELTSVLSFLLIGFYGTRDEARSGALQALIITAGGGLALLVGLVLMGTAAGSMELSQIIANTSLRESPLYSAFTVLILIGCFSKSAQFPLHFWLPGAMSAPTPASAYLHSATMVKAGIYLMLRLSPALGDTSLWQNALMIVGLLTMLGGAAFALRQRDLKAALAYSTISQLGALTALAGLPDGAGMTAALVGILAHSLYKAALFLVVGAVDHSAGTRILDELGGLARHLPGWAVVAALAGLSMAGLPPLLGFVAKESLLDAMLESPLALAIIVCSAAFTVAMSLILVWDVFWGERDKQHHLHTSPRGMLVGPSLLAGGSLLAGVQLQALVAPLISPMVMHDLHLSLFHGLTTPFALSVVAVVSGVAIFATRQTWRAWVVPPLPKGSEIYQQIVYGVELVGDLLLRTQGGKLRYYLLVILGSVALLQATAGLSHLHFGNFQPQFNGSIDVLRILLLLLALGAILASILYRTHLLAALALGVSGYCVGGIFLIEPAPDVALVQFMVETIGTVLLIVMLARIRAEERQQAMDDLWKQSRTGLVRDVLLSTIIGAGVAVFALAAVSSRQTTETIATWHIENSVPLTGIDDVVGAIVTDFRGMDTVIEITVFSVAALGVLTIIARPVRVSGITTGTFRTFKRLVMRRNDDETVEEAVDRITAEEDEPLLSTFSTPLTRVMAQLVLPFSFIVALSHLFYGGDAPGDGFTAGVISGLGVTLWYVVFGYHESGARLKWLNPRGLIGIGLALVIGNAAFPLLIGQPFLAHLSFDQIALPANLHLSSTLVYETGIFLTVLGSVSMVMEAIAYPKEVEPL
jgi:NADH:ubiquinone oxidoreductase subunit 5 (subunit L)/multisubunit Na+/H+ antiporter MnhA subunit/multisubunit Na+/H+ antiporter MnhB subunit